MQMPYQLTGKIHLEHCDSQSFTVPRRPQSLLVAGGRSRWSLNRAHLRATALALATYLTTLPAVRGDSSRSATLISGTAMTSVSPFHHCAEKTRIEAISHPSA